MIPISKVQQNPFRLLDRLPEERRELPVDLYPTRRVRLFENPHHLTRRLQTLTRIRHPAVLRYCFKCSQHG